MGYQPALLTAFEEQVRKLNLDLQTCPDSRELRTLVRTEQERALRTGRHGCWRAGEWSLTQMSPLAGASWTGTADLPSWRSFAAFSTSPTVLFEPHECWRAPMLTTCAAFGS